jgi:hypothetical protein
MCLQMWARIALLRARTRRRGSRPKTLQAVPSLSDARMRKSSHCTPCETGKGVAIRVLSYRQDLGSLERGEVKTTWNAPFAERREEGRRGTAGFEQNRRRCGSELLRVVQPMRRWG